ncbi:MAG: molecular chaperone DjiA [Pseudomonadota bacterium]|nr:molecular chaperone DjiA [Pseudomonadota bacterium]
MSIWGMIIGGAAGAALGGPIGALIGAAAGIAVERGIIAPARAEAGGSDSGRGVAFTVAVIALSAKMAKVDGVVTRNEIAAFRARVHIPPGEVAQVGRFWDLARQTPDGFESYARQVAGMFSPRAPVLEQLLDLLFHIAGSDATISEPEIEYLARVTDIFGFSEDDFQRLLALHAAEGPKPWDILGVDPDIPDDELRRHWKALVRDHHPDRLTADGMPEEFVAAANDRLARINAAYDAMARARGMATGAG